MNIDSKDLKLSWGWFRRFLRRSGFSMRKPTTKVIKPIEELEKPIQEFKARMEEILKSKVYDPAFTTLQTR